MCSPVTSKPVCLWNVPNKNCFVCLMSKKNKHILIYSCSTQRLKFVWITAVLKLENCQENFTYKPFPGLSTTCNCFPQYKAFQLCSTLDDNWSISVIAEKTGFAGDNCQMLWTFTWRVLNEVPYGYQYQCKGTGPAPGIVFFLKKMIPSPSLKASKCTLFFVLFFFVSGIKMDRLQRTLLRFWLL